MTTTTPEVQTPQAPPVVLPVAVEPKRILLRRFLSPQAARYRVLIVEAQPFWVSMPLREIRRKLDMRTFVQPETLMYKILGTGLGVGAGLLLAIIGLQELFKVVFGVAPLFYLLFFGVPLGLPVGAAAGWFLLAPRLGPRPYFRARRLTTVNKETGELIPTIAPLYHSRLMLDAAIRDAQKRTAAMAAKGGSEESVLGVPRISRSDTTREIFNGRDEKEFFKGGLSSWQKIQIVALVVGALAMAGLVIMFAIAGFNSGGSGGPTPGGTPVG